MNKKKIRSFFLFEIAILLGICVYFFFFNSKDIPIENITTDINVNAKQLSNSFLDDENASNILYKGKIIEVTGIVKEVSFLNNRNTLILQGMNKQSGVICDMESTDHIALQKIKEGEFVKIKGICKGFLKDVILLNCILINR